MLVDHIDIIKLDRKEPEFTEMIGVLPLGIIPTEQTEALSKEITVLEPIKE